MKKIGLHSLFCIVFILCGGLKLRAQIELNVLVHDGEPQLSNWLREFSVQGRVDELSNMRYAKPYLAKVEQVSALTAKESSGNFPVSRMYTITFVATDRDSLLSELLNSGDFAFVEENRAINVSGILDADPPNDPGVEVQWYHELIGTFSAWDKTRGSDTVVIGILDTGLDYTHPEFIGRISINTAEDLNGNGIFDPWSDTVSVSGVSGDLNGVDEDGNGYPDDVIGYDFTDQPRSPFGGDYLFADADPMDDNNHGTLVAGIAVANENNGQGGSGIAPGCRVKVLRAFGANGAGEDDDIARAIIYAADNDIRILNFSFGDIYPSRMMHEAIKYAYAKGVVMIASAGNGTGDNVHYPSNFDEVIAVSATAYDEVTQNEFLWPLSSYGATVSLAAPGSGIYAPIVQDTSNDEHYGTFSGTSTAAPMVSAAVALLFSDKGSCTPQQVRGILTSTAEDIGDMGWDHFTGAGRLNVERALDAVGASNVQILSPVNDGGASGSELVIIGNVLDPQFVHFSLEWQIGTEGGDTWIPILSEQAYQVMADTLAIWNISALDSGEYTLRLVVEKSNGSTAEDRKRFIIDRTPPHIEVRRSSLCWDNFERKWLTIFRSSDQGMTRLYYREPGAPDWQVATYDRSTRNGEFLLGPDQLNDVSYEYYLESENAAGLKGVSATDTIEFQSEYIDMYSFGELSYGIPFGHYLETPYDFDGDGLKEVIMSEYNEQLSFGKLKLYEYNVGNFVEIDSVDIKSILIPKDVADADGNGLQELLCSVNDSLYILEQSTVGGFPKTVKYSNLGNGYYAARFADADGDSDQELIVKDFRDYFVMERGMGTYTVTATLSDLSSGYEGSTAPKLLESDLDQDGMTDLVYGDFDGDVLIYEHQGGSTYDTTFVTETELERAAKYILVGDFDQDGNPELFSAVHSDFLRNTDFEYDVAHWVLRIFESTGDDQYALVWEDVLYDIDIESLNAATAGNLDADAGDEIIFSTYPRTYLIDHDGSDYYMRWFHYGSLGTHHVIGDFDGNGINEFALGTDSLARFFELDVTYTGPELIPFVEGYVLDSQETLVKWAASPNATEYRVWRGKLEESIIYLIDSTTNLSYHDRDTMLVPEEDYLYVIQSKNNGLSPSLSDIRVAVALRPHQRPMLDSVRVIDPNQMQAFFSYPVVDRIEDLPLFSLDDSLSPVSIIGNPEGGGHLILSFADSLSAGMHTLKVDTIFLDAYRAFTDTTNNTATFNYVPDTTKYVYFTSWDVISEKEARLDYNFVMDNTVLDPMKYTVYPDDRVTSVRWDGTSHKQVVVTLENQVLGAIGNPVSVEVNNVFAVNGATTKPKEGNLATFTAFQQDLSDVYVYPNPYRKNNVLEGIRFANLTRTATVYIYNTNGRFVRALDESDGDGGVEWNLLDDGGVRVMPGVYLYRVEAPDVEDFIGKFAILE